VIVRLTPDVGSFVTTEVARRDSRTRRSIPTRIGDDGASQAAQCKMIKAQVQTVQQKGMVWRSLYSNRFWNATAEAEDRARSFLSLFPSPHEWPL